MSRLDRVRIASPLVLAACAVLALTASAGAQTLKSGTLTLVVPFAASGPIKASGVTVE